MPSDEEINRLLNPKYMRNLLKNETGKYIVIPTVRFGNVWLMPQPARGTGQNNDTLYHSNVIPPTHQYIAFYLRLNHNFQPDAIIHMGTHGTHEWLPGVLLTV